MTENDFDFIKRGQDEKAVKGTVRRKIKVLPNMMNLFCDGVKTEEQFVKNKVFCSFVAADEGCTLGFSGSEKAARPKSLIKGNELSNPKPADLILRRKTGMTQFDEILLGDEQALSKYRSQIHSMLAENLLIAGSVF